jgi:hypothetical protein
MPTAIEQRPSLLGKQVGIITLLYFSLAEQNLDFGEIPFKRS